MKLVFWCSVAALVGVLIAKLLLGQDVQLVKEEQQKEPPKIIFADNIHKDWLIVGRANSKDPDARGWHPSYSYVLLNDKTLIPTVKKLSDGRYLIQFRSQIAENLP